MPHPVEIVVVIIISSGFWPVDTAVNLAEAYLFYGKQ